MRRSLILQSAFCFAQAAGHCSTPANVQFTGVSTDSASVSWVLDAPLTEAPLMVISTMSDFSTAFSSATGALGAQTTAYYGLTPNATYFFMVKVSTEPDAAYSAAVSTITNPNPPAGLQITAVYSSSIAVSWSGAGNAAGSVYLLRAAQDEAFEVGLVSTLTVAGSRAFEGLALNATYYIRGRTLGFSGAESADANFGSTITLSAQPTTPSYDAVYSSGALLSWNPNGNLPGTQYKILVSSDDFATLIYSSSSASPALAAYGLVPNATYYFKAASLNSAGALSGYTAFPSTLTRANTPGLHGSGSFAGATSDTIEARWLQNSNPVYTEYFLRVSSSPDFQGQEYGAGSWSAWTALVSVTPLDAGVTFYFRARARDLLLRETAWLNLGAKQTLSGADTIPPSVIDLQGGDDAWRGAAGGLYKVHFSDLGSGLSKFEVKLATSPGLAGTPLADWAAVVTDINAQTYETDWQMPLSAFQTITEGVTAYASVRVYDRAPTPNVTVSTDVFYVIRDTTPPTIINNAASPSGWQSSDPGPFNVDFYDARSGLALIQYSAGGSAGAADAALLGWTDIDTPVSSQAYTADWGVAFQALAGGATNYISARAVDAAGNTTTLADAFKILKIAGGPPVAFASPSSGYVSTATALSGSASGGNEGITVNYVEVWLRELAGGKYYDAAGGFSASAPAWLRAAGGQAWSLSVATFGLVNLSSYTAVARANDSLGRYSLVYATSTFTLDQDPPTVSLSSPVALSTVYDLDAVYGGAGDALSGPALAGISVKRLIDGKWWNFLSRTWGSVQSSSFTPVSGGNWTFLPDAWLRGNMLSGYDYFVTAYAADAAAPANLSPAGLAGSTFTFADTVPPGQTVQVSASTDSTSVPPGRLRLTWVFPGDDGGSGLLAAGEFAVKYATFTGFAYSTASAQALISTASVPAGSTQTYLLSGLANSATYYLRLWTKDDAGFWSAASPEFSGLSGEGLPDAIAGHVRTSPGQGITGVLAEAFNFWGASAGSAYTVDDGSGSFAFSGLAAGVYRIQVTWIENGIASSVSKDGIPVGYADADFTLSVNYALASVSGLLTSYRTPLAGRQIAGASAAGYAEVELYRQGRRIAAAAVDGEGKFRISSLLPGEYELRAPGAAPLALRLRSGENLVVNSSAELLADGSVYAYPNPARTRVTFRFQTDGSPVREEINVFDAAGRPMKRIRDYDQGWDRSEPGNIHKFVWNFSASEPAPGVYIYKLNVNSPTTGKSLAKTGKFAVIR